MAARKPSPAREPVVPEQDQRYQVVGDELLAHLPGGDVRLSLVLSMPAIDLWLAINDEAPTWRVQVARWQAEVMPADVRAEVERIAETNGLLAVELSRQWSKGLDVVLGKALS